MRPPRPVTIAAALMLALLPACGGGGEDPVTKAADTSRPLDGRAVSRGAQLQATWMAISDGPYTGVEFLKGDQAMITAGRSMTATVAYRLLDDGRLSLVGPTGQTTVYGATVSGDILELAPESGASGTQRFQKLPSGQTLSEGIAAREAQAREQAERRILALRDLIRKGNTVLTTTEGDDAWVMALAFDDPDRSLNGTMVLDTPVGGRNDALNPVRLLPVLGDTRALDAVSGRVEVLLNVGPATEPSGQQDVRGQVRLTIDGPGDKPVITGQASFPKLWPSPRPVTLKADASLFSKADAKMESQRAAIRAEIDRMHAFLGGRAVFTGQRTALGGANPEPVRLTLERNEQGNAYDATITVGTTRVDQRGQGGVDMVLGQAALYVLTPWGEQWRFQTTDKGDALAGRWRPHAASDFISNGAVDLTLERRWSDAEVAAERAAIQKFLTADLRTPQRFVGIVERRFGATNTVRWPVSVELQAQSDTTVAGTGWMIAHRDGVALSGTRADRSFRLTGSAPLPDSADPRRVSAQAWQLDLAAIDPAPTLVGQGTRNAHGGGRAVLTLATPQHTAALRASLVEALTGARYIARTADTSSVRDEQLYFVFDEVDAASGRVAGRLLGDGTKWDGAPPALFEGAIVEDHAYPLLRLTVRGAPDPVRGKDYEPFTLELCAFELDGVLHLSGSTPPGVGNQSWVTLDPVPDAFVIPMDPARETRLAALRLGAEAERLIYRERKPGDAAVVVVNVTERDARVGQVFFADGRYSHGNSIAMAAIHAGLARPGEVAVLRLTFHEPFTAPVEAVERNGVSSQRGTFKPTNTVPTFRVERVALD